MLQKFVHNADSPDIFTEPLYLRLEAAGAAHDKAHVYPRLAGPVEQPDHGFVCKAVELCVNKGLFSRPGIAYFAFDALGKKRAHALGGGHQLAARNWLVRGIEKIENGSRVFHKAGVGAQQAHIAVKNVPCLR